MGSAIGATVSAGSNQYTTKQTNQANWDIAKMTNESNERIARENLAFQRENLDYQKSLQQTLFDREDSAYQRTVSDMRAAGISPLVMQGTNGAGEAVATTPLQNDYRAQTGAPMQAADMSSLANLGTGLVSFLSSIEQLKQQRLSTDYLEHTYLSRRYSQYADSVSKWYDVLDKDTRKRVNDYFGISSDMPDSVKQAKILAAYLGYAPKSKEVDSSVPSYFGNGDIMSSFKYNSFDEKSDMRKLLESAVGKDGKLSDDFMKDVSDRDSVLGNLLNLIFN